MNALRRAPYANENGTLSTVGPSKSGINPIDLNDSDMTNEKLEDGSPADSKGNANEAGKTLDSSQLMAIQELMVDMSLEERQRFMDQITSQVNSDGLGPDLFYRGGSSGVNSFIRESDQRERLDNPLGQRQTIPLGPQGEDDAA